MTIFHPSAVPLIYGSQSPCQKSAWYHQVSRIDNETSVNTTRDPTSHRLRRRAWDRGLGLKGETPGLDGILRQLNVSSSYNIHSHGRAQVSDARFPTEGSTAPVA